MTDTKLVGSQDTYDVDPQRLDSKTQSTDFNDSKSQLSDLTSEFEGVPIAQKSYGIRRSELIISQMRNPWHKGLFFFTTFLGMYIVGVEYSTINVFVGYATNSYRQHSQMATIGTIGYVASAACMPFFARTADVFGRLEIFIVTLLCKIVGIVIQSQATNIQKYAAGTVFYSFGSSGSVIIWQLCVSDASTLKWRLLALAPMCMPVIINTWSVGRITAELLAKHGWLFGIALWAFTTPLVCVPFMAVYLHLILRARKTSTWAQIKKEERQKFLDDSATARRYDAEITGAKTFIARFGARVKYFFLHVGKKIIIILWDMDFIGCLLVAVILGLLLVPLTLSGGEKTKWQRASTIVPLVMGFVTIPIFAFWEAKLTKKPLLPLELMKDRGVWAGICVGVFSTLIMYMPGSYAFPVLLVGMNATVEVATRTPALASFTEGIAVPIVGLILTKVKRSKAFILFGDVFMFISMGLFVHFRGSSDGVRDKYWRDGVAIAMCIGGVGLGMFYRLGTVSVQACTNHEYMAPVIAIFAVGYTVGAAIAKSISGAIWTQEMLQEIASQMGKLGVDPTLAMTAYATPYDFIFMYAWGSPERIAVSRAYAVIQRKLSIVGVCLCVPMLILILLLRDHKLVDSQNLDDEKLKLATKDHEKNVAEREKSQIVFKDDNDHILNFLRKIVGLKPKNVTN